MGEREHPRNEKKDKAKEKNKKFMTGIVYNEKEIEKNITDIIRPREVKEKTKQWRATVKN